MKKFLVCVLGLAMVFSTSGCFVFRHKGPKPGTRVDSGNGPNFRESRVHEAAGGALDTY